jgi:hypothetical protein
MRSALLALFVVLSGCAVQSQFLGPTVPGLPIAGEGKAYIYIARPTLIGLVVGFPIAVNGEPVGRLQAGRYMALAVPPGTVVLEARGEVASELTFDAAPDQAYYLVAEPRLGMWTPRVQLQPVSPYEGREIISRLTPVSERAFRRR